MGSHMARNILKLIFVNSLEPHLSQNTAPIADGADVPATAEAIAEVDIV